MCEGSVLLYHENIKPRVHLSNWIQRDSLIRYGIESRDNIVFIQQPSSHYTRLTSGPSSVSDISRFASNNVDIDQRPCFRNQ